MRPCAGEVESVVDEAKAVVEPEDREHQQREVQERKHFLHAVDPRSRGQCCTSPFLAVRNARFAPGIALSGPTARCFSPRPGMSLVGTAKR
eukprot:1339553-Rhodomonas_salina.1